MHLLYLQLIPSYSHQDTPSFTSITLISSLFSTLIMTSLKESSISSISSISPLTSENYHSWADDVKSWLQLNGLWHLVSGLEKKPAAKPKINDSSGSVITPAVAVDEDKLERWEIKAEKAAGALKTAISPDIRVLIRDCENDPLLIWDTLKTSFIQQRTAPHFNAYHALLSVEKKDSESLEGLINRIDEQIRVIKLLSPTSFTLDNLYDELAVMTIIRALPHSFDNVVRTISVLDKFDKQSVIQLLQTWTRRAAIFLECPQHFLLSQHHRGPFQSHPQFHLHQPLLHSLPHHFIMPTSLRIAPSVTSALTLAM